ncbi:hypothetical protein [Scytonema sp. NUACC26]|uniref:hypothetical protein n=1 Tax=Scytonema sp. NUACC26 TaxID=3140176 RepID=UPI0034DC8AF6
MTEDLGNWYLIEVQLQKMNELLSTVETALDIEKSSSGLNLKVVDVTAIAVSNLDNLIENNFDTASEDERKWTQDRGAEVKDMFAKSQAKFAKSRAKYLSRNFKKHL